MGTSFKIVASLFKVLDGQLDLVNIMRIQLLQQVCDTHPQKASERLLPEVFSGESANHQKNIAIVLATFIRFDIDAFYNKLSSLKT